ncbi:hypothetical protein PR202_gb01607 [Eleusine coracana subsp. coracana]|uniref:Cation/H(+) antiporter central domain-containing protein n=1 Tax=Eleusine coracana subsp. coracana TaxID=191504 RepID=A0AAV5DWH7_ELECO|nr:hypothetical protein PR202_gb01607 [Eleusine coracana subsp. coracana]
MLACVHTTRNVPSIISLLELSNPTKRSPIFIYALHLVELTGRASNMLAAQHHSAASSGSTTSDHMFNAFENYEESVGGVSVQSLTAVSPYATMHEDVSVLAEDKHVSLIVLPFHKQQTVDGGMEPINASLRGFNESILAAAPCSVGILVDRGLSAAAARLAAVHHVARCSSSAGPTTGKASPTRGGWWRTRACASPSCASSRPTTPRRR